MDWCRKTYGNKMQCDCDYIDKASGLNYFDVLNWWINSGIRMDYTEKALDRAIETNNEEMVKWWINSGQKLKYTV